MPVNRELYAQKITKGGAPNWPCPRCGGGHLRLINDSLSSCMAGDTYEESSEMHFEPEMAILRFVAILKCDNDRCRESSVVAGTGYVEDWSYEVQDYREFFVPDYICPSPRLITIPSSSPASVTKELEQAFTASWGDYSSAGNRIRAAVERLMDDLNIPKTTIAKGKRKPLTLHSRIDKAQKKVPRLHESLLAIKWLGNAGSHSTALTQKDVFDALDIFEIVLDELYSQHSSTIEALVKRVNRRKGPARKRANKT